MKISKWKASIKRKAFKPLWMIRIAIKATNNKSSWNRYRRRVEHVGYQHYCMDRNAATNIYRNARRDFESHLAKQNNPKAFHKLLSVC